MGRDPTVISTVLGSCVAVCLYDHVRQVGGMNHYVLALWNGDGLATPKYGNIAIERLIERLTSCDFGCRVFDLQAKIFGGASILDDRAKGFNIGQRNVNIAFNTLAKKGIEIISSDVGGNVGRKLHFHTDTGDVFLKRMNAENKRT